MAQVLPTDGFGIYEAVVPTAVSTYQARLQAIAAGGFSLVLNYNLLYGTAADIAGYINYAASVGLKVIVTLKDTTIWRDNTYPTTYTLLYADSGNAATGIAFMQYIVDNTKNLPGTWGWYVGDEVVPADHTVFKTYCDAIKTRDSTHPRLFTQDGHQTYSVASGTSTFGDCCDVMGDDIYPVGVSVYTYTVDRQAANVQTFCTTNSLGVGMTLQAFSWAQYNIPATPYPTYWQMLQMQQGVLANTTSRLLLWYSYFDTLAIDNSAQHWADLVAVVKAGASISISPAGNCKDV
jgi:hypothetical protein